jgi:hydroxymethylbilane synthase
VLESLGGGCQVPIGAYAEIEGARMFLRAVVIAPEGDSVVKGHLDGNPEEAARLGRTLGERLLASGATHILEQVYGRSL